MTDAQQKIFFVVKSSEFVLTADPTFDIAQLDLNSLCCEISFKLIVLSESTVHIFVSFSSLS